MCGYMYAMHHVTGLAMAEWLLRTLYTMQYFVQLDLQPLNLLFCRLAVT